MSCAADLLRWRSLLHLPAMRYKHRTKCVQIHCQTAGGTWERPRVSLHDDRYRGGEGQGRGHSAPRQPRESSPSKTAVFRAELPERGQAHRSRRPGLIQDLGILGWHLENGS